MGGILNKGAAWAQAVGKVILQQTSLDTVLFSNLFSETDGPARSEAAGLAHIVVLVTSSHGSGIQTNLHAIAAGTAGHTGAQFHVFVTFEKALLVFSGS